MAKVIFDNGQTVEFDRPPSPDEIDEVAQTLGAGSPTPKGSLTPGSVQQVAGDLPRPSTLRGMLPTKEELPEFIGSMAGNFARRTIPGAIVAGAGAAIGNVGEQAREAIFDPIKAPHTFLDSARRTGGAFLRGAVGETAGRGAAAAIGKIFSPFAGSVSKEAVDQLNTARRAGIEPSVSNISDSPTVQALERYSEFSPFGGFITRMKDAALGKLESFSSRISDGISKIEKAPAVFGEEVAGRIDSFRKAFHDESEKLYGPIMDQLRGAPVDVSRTIAKLEDIISRRSGSLEPSGLGKLRDLLAELKGQGPSGGVGGGAIVRNKAPEAFGSGSVGMTKVGGGDVRVSNFPESTYGTERVEATLPGTAAPGGSRSGGPMRSPTSESLPGMAAQQPESLLQSEVVGSRPGGGSLRAPDDIAMPGMATGPREGVIRTIGDLKNAKTNLGAMGDFRNPGAVGLKADIDGLYGVMNGDIRRAAERVDPQLAKALGEVDDYYAVGINKLKSQMVNAISKVSETQPSNLHKAVFVRNRDYINVAKEVLGQDAFNDLRKKWFDEVITRSNTTSEGKTVLSPFKLTENLRKMEPVLDDIFSDNPRLLSQVKDLADISKMMTRGRRVTGGSQTGFILDALKTIRGALAAGTLATKVGREYLTTGLPKAGARVGGAARRVVQPTTQIGLQKITGEE